MSTIQIPQMIDQPGLVETFRCRFGREAAGVACAPGRVNVIGEHTDYNGGFVLPAAIDRGISLALARRDDRRIRLVSLDYEEVEEREVPTGDEASPSPRRWANYIVAVVQQLVREGFHVGGFEAVLAGDVPRGAGLSSSAALEVAVGVGLRGLFGFQISRQRLALLGQAAEHSPLIGVQCGIMDQMISALGQPDHALWIDCHSLDCRPVPLPGDRAAILILNSMVRRGLVDSEYNRRRAECAEGLKLLSQLEGKDFLSLRHAGLSVFLQHENRLPEVVRRRVRHVVSENDRVEEAVMALGHGDLEKTGALLNCSHESLRDDYEVSCPPLDLLAELLQSSDGVYGARMTGAGFGGCVVALVRPERVEAVGDEVAGRYSRETGNTPDTFITPACSGARYTPIG